MMGIRSVQKIEDHGYRSSPRERLEFDSRKKYQPFAIAITPVCLAGLRSILSLPPLNFIYVQRSTIVGCSELPTVGSKALRLLPTPSVLRWTS